MTLEQIENAYANDEIPDSQYVSMRDNAIATMNAYLAKRRAERRQYQAECRLSRVGR
jgi:hypothetical protein